MTWPYSGSAFCEGQQLARPGRVAQLLQCLHFDLADAFAGHPDRLADLFQRVVGHSDSEPHPQNALLTWREPRERLGHAVSERGGLGRRVRIVRVRRLEQIAQGGIAILADGNIE